MKRLELDVAPNSELAEYPRRIHLVDFDEYSNNNKMNFQAVDRMPKRLCH